MPVWGEKLRTSSNLLSNCDLRDRVPQQKVFSLQTRRGIDKALFDRFFQSAGQSGWPQNPAKKKGHSFLKPWSPLSEKAPILWRTKLLTSCLSTRLSMSKGCGWFTVKSGLHTLIPIITYYNPLKYHDFPIISYTKHDFAMTIAYIVVWSLHLSGSMGSESRWAAGRSSTPVAMPDELTQLPMKPLHMYIYVYVCGVYIYIHVRVCLLYLLYVCPSIYLSVCLSVCLSIYLSIYLSISLSLSYLILS